MLTFSHLPTKMSAHEKYVHLLNRLIITIFADGAIEISDAGIKIERARHQNYQP
jgi:hypothetical protein